VQGLESEIFIVQIEPLFLTGSLTGSMKGMKNRKTIPLYSIPLN